MLAKPTLLQKAQVRFLLNCTQLDPLPFCIPCFVFLFKSNNSTPKQNSLSAGKASTAPVVASWQLTNSAPCVNVGPVVRMALAKSLSISWIMLTHCYRGCGQWPHHWNILSCCGTLYSLRKPPTQHGVKAWHIALLHAGHTVGLWSKGTHCRPSVWDTRESIISTRRQPQAAKRHTQWGERAGRHSGY